MDPPQKTSWNPSKRREVVLKRRHGRTLKQRGFDVQCQAVRRGFHVTEYKKKGKESGRQMPPRRTTKGKKERRRLGAKEEGGEVICDVKNGCEHSPNVGESTRPKGRRNTESHIS